MKLLLAAALLAASIGTASAQAPGGAPAGSTGVCKDGTYSAAASKRGACAGHKGVKDWYANDTASEPATAPATKSGASAPAGAAAATPAASQQTLPSTGAAGGGNGQVWVNTKSKVYHCEGDRYYGKTKAGSYMTEAAAVAAGNRADHGKACKS